MTTITTAQTHLTEYAQDVLRHNGVKSSRAWWPNPQVLALVVQPYAVAKAARALPVIQQRADKFGDVRVVIEQPGADLGVN
jgi:hypothetical protein